MPIDRYLDYSFQELMPIYGKGSVSQLNFMPNLSIVAGQALGQVSAANVTEIQIINLLPYPTAGTFTLSVPGEDGGTYTTGNLAYNIAMADLRTAIRELLFAAGYDTAIRYLKDGSVDPIGDPNGLDISLPVLSGTTNMTVTFTFTGMAVGFNMPQISANIAGLTTTTSTTNAGETAGQTIGLWGPYDDGASDGRQVCRAFAQYGFQTDEVGRVIFVTPVNTVGGTPGVTSSQAPSAPPEFGNYGATAPAYFKGRFKLADLSYLASGTGNADGTLPTGVGPVAGLDSNGIADVGRLESGTSIATNAILTIY